MLVEGVGGGEPVQDEAIVGRADGGLVQAQFLVHPWLGQQIARQVLPHKLVIGYVRIECPYQVVAVAVGVGDVWVALAPVGIRIAHPVHPVAGPPLPELGRGQEIVHQFLRCGLKVSLGVLCESFLLLDGGGQARQGECQASQDREGIGLLVGDQFGLFQAGQHVTVHGVARPILVPGLGGIRLADGLEAPPLLAPLAYGFP